MAGNRCVLYKKAILCNFSSVVPSKDKKGNIVEDAFKMTFPNGKAIYYNLSGAISFVLP